jgi:hypothetical protein
MPGSLGPILAAGGITYGNAVLVNNQSPYNPAQARIIVATLISAAGLSLMEKAMPATATAVAWLALASVLLVRVDPKTPSPLESFASWLNTGGDARIGSQTTTRTGRSA